jgi:hypothetical protein
MEYNILSTSDDRFFCQICDDRLPTFSNSFFDTSDDVNINDDLPCHTDGCSGHRRTVKLILSGDVETCFVSPEMLELFVLVGHFG